MVIASNHSWKVVQLNSINIQSSFFSFFSSYLSMLSDRLNKYSVLHVNRYIMDQYFPIVSIVFSINKQYHPTIQSHTFPRNLFSSLSLAYFANRNDFHHCSIFVIIHITVDIMGNQTFRCFESTWYNTHEKIH